MIAGNIKLGGVGDELKRELESGEGDTKNLDGGPDLGVKAVADPLRALGGKRARPSSTGEGRCTSTSENALLGVGVEGSISESVDGSESYSSEESGDWGRPPSRSEADIAWDS